MPAPSSPRDSRPASDVSIVLVSWNAASVIASCLSSLEHDRHEIIVIDNASSDGTADSIEASFPFVRLHRNRVNEGFAAGVNAGVRIGRGAYVLMLNCDTVAEPGSIDRLAEVLRGEPSYAAAGGALFDPEGRSQHGFQVRRFPTLTTWLVDLWLVDKIWPDNPATRRYLAHDQTHDTSGPVDVEQPAAACLMVRHDVLDALQGLDEGFFPAWFEDVDLCRRMKAAGWRIAFVPDARFRHVGGLAMKRLGLGAFSLVWYRNLQRYVLKHQGGAALIACKLLIVTGMMARMVIVLLRGRWRDAVAYGRVALDALTSWPATTDPSKP